MARRSRRLSAARHRCSSLSLSAAVAALAAVATASPARAHGFAKEPRSRNAAAAEDGRWWCSSAGTCGPEVPRPESCPQCLNRRGPGVCGMVGGNDYSSPMNAAGAPLDRSPQAVYREGQVITVKSVLTAHHMGHFEMRACGEDGGSAAAQACFDAHPLTFVQDVLYSGPADPTFTERAYVAPNDGSAGLVSSNALPAGGGMEFEHKYRLPEGVSGRVVLQWRYVTANSCKPTGYDDYFAAFGAAGAEWWNAALPDCPSPLPPTGEGTPEQFWNCIDVDVSPSDGGFVAEPFPPPPPPPQSASPASLPPPPLPLPPSPPPPPRRALSPPPPAPASDDSPSEECSLQSGHYLEPTPSCEGFRHCQSGAYVSDTIACPDGTLFNYARQYCDWPYNFQC